MLGVFLLAAFTRLGHECQDLLSLSDGMHVCTDKTSVYTLTRKSFEGNGGQNPCFEGNGGQKPKEKIPYMGKKISSKEDRTYDAASSRTANPTHYQRAIPARAWRLNRLIPCGRLFTTLPRMRSLQTTYRRIGGISSAVCSALVR